MSDSGRPPEAVGRACEPACIRPATRHVGPWGHPVGPLASAPTVNLLGPRPKCRCRAVERSPSSGNVTLRYGPVAAAPGMPPSLPTGVRAEASGRIRQRRARRPSTYVFLRSAPDLSAEKLPREICYRCVTIWGVTGPNSRDEAEETPERIAPGRGGERAWCYCRAGVNSKRPRSVFRNRASLPFLAVSRMIAA